MGPAFSRKYGTGTGADVYIPMVKRGVVDFAVSADWTPAAGDVKVSKDGAAAANIGTLPTAVTMGNTAMWKFVFADAELQCKFLSVTVADSATKAVEDQMFAVETYGNASAMYQADLSAANLPANVIQINGTAQTARDIGASVLLSAGTGTGQLDFTTGVVKANVTQFGGTNGTSSGGRPEVNVSHFGGTAGTFALGRAEVNTTHFGGTAGTFAAGRPEVNLTHVKGNVAPSTTGGGYLDVSVAKWGAADVSLDGTGTYPVVTLQPAETPMAHSGTAQATGNDSTHIKLAAGASATTDKYKGQRIKLYSGTGSPAARVITAYDGTTKIATLDWALDTTADNTTKYGIDYADAPKLDSSLQVVSASVQGNVTGSVASVTGAVGSVTGAVGSVTGAVGSVTAAVTVGTNNDKIGYRLSATGVDDVWDEVLSGHLTAGTTGAALNASSSAGDPWATSLPGAYGAGTAGNIIGNNLNATISSRMATFTLPTNFSSLGINASGHISRVVLCDTLTTYTGNTVQTGDSFARLGAPAGASVSADVAAVKSDSGILVARLTGTRAGNLDFLTGDAFARLQTYRLDQLFLNDVGTPGAGSLIGDLTEDNSGTRRFTVASLVNAPAGGGGGGSLTADQNTKLTEIWENVQG
jgi:hypothetical protein